MEDWASPSPFLLGLPDEQPQDIARANSCLAIVLGSLLVGLSCPGRSPTLKGWSCSIRLCQFCSCFHVSLLFAILDCLIHLWSLGAHSTSMVCPVLNSASRRSLFCENFSRTPLFMAIIYVLLSYCHHCYCLVLFLLNLATTWRARLCHSSST